MSGLCSSAPEEFSYSVCCQHHSCHCGRVWVAVLQVVRSRLGSGYYRHVECSCPCSNSPPPASSSLCRFCFPLVLASLPTMATGEEITPALQDSWGDFWLFRFFVNAAGYASIVVPGFLLIQYFKRRNYLETGRSGSFPSTSCVPWSSLPPPQSTLLRLFPQPVLSGLSQSQSCVPMMSRCCPETNFSEAPMPADLEASEEGGFTSQAGAACGAQALVNCVSIFSYPVQAEAFASLSSNHACLALR